MDSTSFRRLTSRLPDPLLAAGLGALVAAVLALAWAVWLGYPKPTFHEQPEYGPVLILVAGCVALFVIPKGFNGKARTPLGDAILLSVPMITAGMASLSLFLAWWRVYATIGTRPLLNLVVIAVLLLMGISLSLFTARRIRHDIERRSSQTQGGADNAEAGTEEADDVAHAADHRAPLKPWARTALVACAPAAVVALLLAVPGVLLPAPDLELRPALQLADTIDEEALPALPTAAPTKLGWQTTVMGVAENFALASGVRGPILMTDDGLTALDGENGSVLWSYRVPGAGYVHTSDDHPEGAYLLVTSPDRRHIAFGVITKDTGFKNAKDLTIVVLDTMTGRTTAQRPLPSVKPPLLQLTDSAALIGAHVIALDGGNILGRIDEDELWDEDQPRSGTAGRSTFILPGSSETTGSPEIVDTSAILVPVSNPTARITLPHTCPDPLVTYRRGVNQGPWMATCEEATRTPDTATVWTMSAVNIDEVAATGDAATVEKTPLGKGTGINSDASRAADTLITIPEDAPYYIEATGDVSEGTPRTGWIGVVLNPQDRTAIPAEQSASIGASVISGDPSPHGAARPGTEVRITPANGAEPLSFSTPTGAPLGNEYGETELVWSEKRSFKYGNPYAISTPGCSVIALVTTRVSNDNHPSEITVYGVM
ncbi:hypothetical protein ACSL103130_01075 [Actinomyces slackii]|uniref:Uncharacterized protein n=1 Tax=Actinomyces slackii TaxID=52774 RepID=A0A448KAW9_9ACTO|nr:hypothetical protein [Actinomyces slackii]VEG74063.1 Uncharacterised protein [Actinomyces slackii]